MDAFHKPSIQAAGISTAPGGFQQQMRNRPPVRREEQIPIRQRPSEPRRDSRPKNEPFKDGWESSPKSQAEGAEERIVSFAWKEKSMRSADRHT